MTHIMRIDEMFENTNNLGDMLTNLAFDAIRKACPRSYKEFEAIEDDGAYGVRMLAYPGEMECLSDEWEKHIKEVEDAAREDYERDVEFGDTDKTFDEYLEDYNVDEDPVGYYYLKIEENGTNYTIMALAEIEGVGITIGSKVIFEQDVVFDKSDEKAFNEVLDEAAEALYNEI